jgi:hypothetical protein
LSYGFGDRVRHDLAYGFTKMALTVRIDEATHALLKQLADDDNLNLNEELALAVKARKKEKFFAEMRAGYAAMTAEQRGEDAAEMAPWDGALGDGLDDG